MFSNAEKILVFIFWIVVVRGQETSTSLITNSTIEEYEELIQNLEELPSSLTLFAASEKSSYFHTTQSKIAFLPLLAVAANTISLINGIMTLCEKLEHKKQQINENKILALQLEEARRKVVAKLDEVQYAIDSGIAKILDRTIQQQFEDQVTINMAQLSILTEYYLNAQDGADRKALQEQCANNPPASFMGVLKKLLPRFMDLTNDPADYDLFNTKAHLALTVVQQFILAYPACNSILKFPFSGNVNKNALGTIKEVLTILDNSYAENERVLENIIYPVVDKFIGFKDEMFPDDEKHHATSNMEEELRPMLARRFNYSYNVILYEERNLPDFYQSVGKIYSRTAANRTAHVLVAKQKIAGCPLSNTAYCKWETVSETFSKVCPNTQSMFAMNVIEYRQVEKLKNVGVTGRGYSDWDIYPGKDGCISNFKIWYSATPP